MSRPYVLSLLGILLLVGSACVSTPGAFVDAGTPGAPGTPGPQRDAGVLLACDAASVLSPGDAGVADVAVTVSTCEARRPISPLIYGINGSEGASVARPALVRLGGNRWTAYNWENNASNAGADWLYQNDDYLSSSDVPGEAVRTGLQLASGLGGALLVTVPIVDYVAADKLGGGDIRSSPDYQTTRLVRNRARSTGTPDVTPDLTDGAVYQDAFVRWIREARGQTPVLFSLDNEPDLWAETHPEVHPEPVGYEELVSRNLEFASMVKDVWPEAEVTGFVSYGWNGYLWLQGALDGEGKGEFLDFWLSRMKAAEQAAGRRLVDYLDLHWYPEAEGGGTRVTDTSTAPAVVQARVDAPLSLWSPTYQESSWIADTLGEPVRLIPRLQEKIAALYPGTKLAFTEWNFGGGQHISGALATADVLGIFGREGVHLANLWDLNEDERFSWAAFGAYRDFDGAGSAFGDLSVLAQSSDVMAVTAYAAVDSGDPDRLVLVLINKTSTQKSTALRIHHARAYSSADRWQLTAAAAGMTAAGVTLPVDLNAFRLELPARSVTTLAFDLER